LVDDRLGMYSRNCAGKVSCVNPLIVVVFILHWLRWAGAGVGQVFEALCDTKIV
jgi:hypothetical protein